MLMVLTYKCVCGAGGAGAVVGVSAPHWQGGVDAVATRLRHELTEGIS